MAICEINRGGHSILLTGRDEAGWLVGFDPSWDNIIQSKKGTTDGMAPSKYELFPGVSQDELGVVNIRIEPAYLMADRTGGHYQMGPVSSRNITILENIN